MLYLVHGLLPYLKRMQRLRQSKACVSDARCMPDGLKSTSVHPQQASPCWPSTWSMPQAVKLTPTLVVILLHCCRAGRPSTPPPCRACSSCCPSSSMMAHSTPTSGAALCLASVTCKRTLCHMWLMCLGPACRFPEVAVATVLVVTDVVADPCHHCVQLGGLPWLNLRTLPYGRPAILDCGCGNLLARSVPGPYSS